METGRREANLRLFVRISNSITSSGNEGAILGFSTHESGAMILYLVSTDVQVLLTAESELAPPLLEFENPEHIAKLIEQRRMSGTVMF
jgi:hypothetical protein